ncbi:MAG TPA: biopolymer transporter ExbD [Thermoguttaceae bacterium]|nr:biopolymer transporter ExbD [Thermoguttaceae bacterium]
MIDESQATAVEEPEDDLEDEEPMLTWRPMTERTDLDMTSMMDCVFLLLIFFLVSSAPDQDTSVELPPAHYGGGVTQESSVIITVADREGDLPAAVYLGDGTGGTPVSDDPKQQEATIIDAVTKGVMSGEKSSVLIKAARKVRHKYVSQVAIAVGKADIEDIKMHIAVFEKE